jgi:hypothetical protein
MKAEQLTEGGVIFIVLVAKIDKGLAAYRSDFHRTEGVVRSRDSRVLVAQKEILKIHFRRRQSDFTVKSLSRMYGVVRCTEDAAEKAAAEKAAL